MSMGPEPHRPHVLIINADAMERAALALACRNAGLSVLAVNSVGEVEHWPLGQIVVTDVAHLMPLWLQFGAAAVVVLVHQAGDGAQAAERGATHWLHPPLAPDAVATMVLALAAPLAGSGSEQPG